MYQIIKTKVEEAIKLQNRVFIDKTLLEILAICGEAEKCQKVDLTSETIQIVTPPPKAAMKQKKGRSK